MQFSKTIAVSLLISAGLLSSAAHALSPPTPTPTVVPSYPAWDSASTYTAGQRVIQNGTIYEAQWWTKGDSPATAGEWGAWKIVTIVATPTPVPTPTNTPSSIVTEPLNQARASISGSCLINGSNFTGNSWQVNQQYAVGVVISASASSNAGTLVFKAVAAHLSTGSNKPFVSADGTTITYDKNLWQPLTWLVLPCPPPTPTPSAVPTPTATATPTPTATPIVNAVAAWNTTTVYTAGKRATYNGRIYEAKWYTVGENPSTTGQWGVWKDLGLIATPSPSPSPSPSPAPTPTFSPSTECAAGWNPNKTYTAGSIVSLQLDNASCGVKVNNYRALLSSSAQNPDGSPATWQLLNTCAMSGCPQPTPTPIPTPTATPTATPISGTVYQASSSNWKNDATGAYSMMHDDLCAWITDGQIDFAAPALKQRGLVASFGMITGSCGDKHWAAAKQFIADGNEIFSHSRSHADANSATWDAATQISGSSDDIATRLEGYRPSFFAWPSDVAADAPLAYLRNAAGFIGGRAANRVDASGMVVYDGHAGGVNAAPVSDAYQVRWDLYTDQGQWSAYEAQVKAGGDLLNLHVDAAIANGGWATRTMHGVNDTSWMSVPLAKYTAHLDYVKAKVDAGALWVAGPSDVIKYRYARDFCKANLISTASIPAFQSIVFETTSPECQKYATPITIKVIHNHSSLKATQAGKAVAVTTGKIMSGDMYPITRYDYVTVNPLAGSVSLGAQ